MSITSILNTARSALFASQTCLSVTSNNVANANTEGYMRQEAVLTESVSVQTGSGFIGSGVTVSEVTACYDKYIEASVAEENGSSEMWEAYETYFSRIESILEEDNSSLTTSITDFFNAWETLSTDTTSSTALTGVVTAGENVAQTISSIYSELKDLQNELNSSVGQTVDEVNTILDSIAELNNQIYKTSASGTVDATLVSQRTELVSELSGIMNIQYFEDQNGGLTIMTTDGQLLVDGVYANSLTAETSDADGLYRVVWNSSSGTTVDITDSIEGGSLAALIDLRDSQVTAFLDEVNDLAVSLATEVNTLHSSGYSSNGSTGVNFFNDVTTDGDYAAIMDISDEVNAGVDYIAVSTSAESTSGNETVLAIGSLGSDSVTIDGQSTTYVDFCAAVMSEIGGLSENAQTLSEYHQNLLTSLETQRDSVSGVSTEEEMTNLIKYQYAYQAASRLITVADELLSSLMEVLQ